jgi:hypothetical protein
MGNLSPVFPFFFLAFFSFLFSTPELSMVTAMDISMELEFNSGTLPIPPPSPLVFAEKPLLQMRVSFLNQSED